MKAIMKHNPIFDFTVQFEGPIGFEDVIDAMGFDYRSWHYDIDDILKLPNGEGYLQKPHHWLGENWEIDVPEGYTVISVFDHEDGPFTYAVKPKNQFATTLLKFGFSEVAQLASRIDSLNNDVKNNERLIKLQTKRLVELRKQIHGKKES